jgi:mono/diheme cytochrome c family protein
VNRLPRLSQRTIFPAVFLAVMVAAVLVLSACGSGSDKNPRATSTTLPLFQEVQTPTIPAVFATAEATATVGAASVSTPNPTAVARGASNWDRLECATCHGPNGEGGASEIDGTPAPSLQHLTLTETQFIDWMRSGGTLGSKHQYSTDRLSASGGENLYQYLLSLQTGQ